MAKLFANRYSLDWRLLVCPCCSETRTFMLFEPCCEIMLALLGSIRRGLGLLDVNALPFLPLFCKKSKQN